MDDKHCNWLFDMIDVDNTGSIDYMTFARWFGTFLANFLFIDSPFFEVNIEMTATGAVMNPTLGEIQTAVNACARAVRAPARMLLPAGRGQA